MIITMGDDNADKQRYIGMLLLPWSCTMHAIWHSKSCMRTNTRLPVPLPEDPPKYAPTALCLFFIHVSSCIPPFIFGWQLGGHSKDGVKGQS